MHWAPNVKRENHTCLEKHHLTAYLESSMNSLIGDLEFFSMNQKIDREFGVARSG